MFVDIIHEKFGKLFSFLLFFTREPKQSIIFILNIQNLQYTTVSM